MSLLKCLSAATQVTAFGFLSLLCTSLCADESQLPNVVLIFADDMGYGDVSSYDPASKIKTPHLDNLASEGMKFTDAHTASGVCTPSRYSLLTGRYSWRTRLKSGVLTGYSKPLIEDGRLTIGSLLKQKGYTTACIGKWHLGMDWRTLEGDLLPEKMSKDGKNVDHTKRLGRTPNSNGFDYFFGIAASLDMPPYVWIENDQVVAQPKEGYEVSGGRPGPTADGWRHEDVMPKIGDQTIKFINENKSKPFFVYVPLNAPHTPHAPSENFVGKSGLDAYGDFMVQVDHTIGRIVGAVDENGLRDNTIVIVTSDNGPEVNMYSRRQKTGHDSSSHFLGAKRDNWEGGHRVPFIVRWPGVVASGNSCDQTVGTVDIMATLADVTGQSLPDNSGQDSLSFLPLLKGEPATTERKNHAWIHHSGSGNFAIRQGKWKLLIHSGSGGNPYSATKSRAEKDSPENNAGSDSHSQQLFDIIADPDETNNLIDQQPGIATQLRTIAGEIVSTGRSTPGKPQPFVNQNWKQLDWLNAK